MLLRLKIRALNFLITQLTVLEKYYEELIKNRPEDDARRRLIEKESLPALRRILDMIDESLLQSLEEKWQRDFDRLLMALDRLNNATERVVLEISQKHPGGNHVA
ncbi:MAG: hypothetical protein UT02_C0014G0010 [Parcubacteria group bacterium GW2011_GWC2_38_7]|nr:MAG: hypothetical protein UT02_C0014G0010 [Parcubacteria group bacterium GW2011_GWC2_38_7]